VADRVAVRPRDDIADLDGDRLRHEGRALDVDGARRRKCDQREREQSARDDEGRGPRDRRAPHGHTLRLVPACESADAPFAALARDAERIGVRLDAATLAQCVRFSGLVIERNTTMNLTAITKPADIATKHFLDSFTAIPVRTWTGHERIIDVGSGAGFPGLALHLALPETQVTLVESMGKKARFLEEVTSTLAIEGVEVRNERAEALAPARRERYDVGTARAVGSLGTIVEYLLPFLKIGGDAIAWKGRLDAELAGARKACASIGGEIVTITPTSELGLGAILPGRSLVVIRKLRATPSRYPRSAAEAKRRPW
jgi:16S rRNA (guanine527-N7)-methyltransferase